MEAKVLHAAQCASTTTTSTRCTVLPAARSITTRRRGSSSASANSSSHDDSRLPDPGRRRTGRRSPPTCRRSGWRVAGVLEVLTAEVKRSLGTTGAITVERHGGLPHGTWRKYFEFIPWRELRMPYLRSVCPRCVEDGRHLPRTTSFHQTVVNWMAGRGHRAFRFPWTSRKWFC